jgi:Nucleotidyltransferase
MTGVPERMDDAYVSARRVLLDALEALQDHRDALVLVGAQAIYLHTGEGTLAVAPYTSDADLALNPSMLAGDPKIDALMRHAGFVRAPNLIGTWLGRGDVPVDLLVPEAVGGPGKRAARLGPHGNNVARKGRGLEAALVENSIKTISALEDDDPRQFDVVVAGPAALLVAKLHKIADRRPNPRRQDNKDALDVYRILQERGTDELAAGIQRLLSDEQSAEVTREALTYLDELFGSAESVGSGMAGQAVEGIEDPATIAESSTALARDLLIAVAAAG